MKKDSKELELVNLISLTWLVLNVCQKQVRLETLKKKVRKLTCPYQPSAMSFHV